MRYTIHINAVKCQEWGLNLNQGALFDLLNQASSWAKSVIIGCEVYYWISRNMIINEIPLAYSKPDTVYRAFKDLSEKGLIIHVKQGQKDLIRLTEKGKEWNAKISEINPTFGNKSDFLPKNEQKNSEINPTFSQKLGNKSEKTAENSDLNPTDKNTNYPNTKNQCTSDNAHEKTESTKSDKSKNKTDKKLNPELGIKPPVKIQDLIDLGVSPQVAHDFLRKKKNHEITHTALVRNQNQAKKANLTLAQALEFTVEKDWQAFTADYYFNATRTQQTQQNTGLNYANHQPSNQSQQFDTGTTYGYASKLTADAQAYYAQQGAQQRADRSNPIDVHCVEGTF